MAGLPREMIAIDPEKPGGADVLVPVTRPVPVPGDGEVLVKVAAAGVNRPDVLQRMGLYPMPPGAPTIMGLEIAGEVVALGEGVHRLHIGQEVCALVAGGGYAEYCAAPEGQCLPIPICSLSWLLAWRAPCRASFNSIFSGSRCCCKQRVTPQSERRSIAFFTRNGENWSRRIRKRSRN